MLPPEKLISYLNFDGLMEELERKSNFDVRVQLTLQAIENALPLNIKCEQKDPEESKNLKTEADRLIIKQRGRFKAMLQALELYSKSLAKADKSTTTLSQTYANRSAILFQLNKYTECINDIDRALKLNYPDHLRANLLRRKAKCLKILGKTEADEICEEARRWLESVTLSDDKKEKLEMKINNATKVEEYAKEETETKSKHIDLPAMVRHDYIPSASDAIDIKYNTDLGKHLVANRDIDAGEVLIIEKPYASILSIENIYTHCSQCFVRAWNSIPCEYCVHAMYCSEKCRSEAWEQYHDIECAVKGYLLAMKMNDLAPFSLKLTVLAVRESGSIQQLRKNLEQIDDCRDYLMKCFTDDGIYSSDKYQPLYSLLTHEANRKRYEILTLSLNAAFILYYVFTHTSFFGKSSDKSIPTLYKNEDAMFVGKLIARHFMIIQMNDDEFCEFRDEEYFRIGAVLGSVTSLLNHSCNPNVSKCSVLKNGVTQVVYALKPIEANSQILINYGCEFCFTPKSERETILKNYFLNCNCKACDDIWPLFEDLPSILAIIKDKDVKVEVARAIVRSKKYQNYVFEVGLDKYEGNKEEILKGLADSISIVSESTYIPTKEYYELLELFRQTFYQIHGHKFLS